MSSVPRGPDSGRFQVRSGGFTSGVIPQWQSTSGVFGPPSGIDCRICGKTMGAMGVGTAIREAFVRVEGNLSVSGRTWDSWTYCMECAGYLFQERRFETREDWIRDGLDFLPETPCLVIADFLEDAGRNKDADWLRLHRSGR